MTWFWSSFFFLIESSFFLFKRVGVSNSNHRPSLLNNDRDICGLKTLFLHHLNILSLILSNFKHAYVIYFNGRDFLIEACLNKMYLKVFFLQFRQELYDLKCSEGAAKAEMQLFISLKSTLPWGKFVRTSTPGKICFMCFICQFFGVYFFLKKKKKV